MRVSHPRPADSEAVRFQGTSVLQQPADEVIEQVSATVSLVTPHESGSDAVDGYSTVT
jgi:hypothetical protein